MKSQTDIYAYRYLYFLYTEFSSLNGVQVEYYGVRPGYISRMEEELLGTGVRMRFDVNKNS